MALLILAAWVLHEGGHWLALRFLGLGGEVRWRGWLGVAVEVDAACQGWREAVVAVAGPLVNILAALFGRCLGCEAWFQANFVLAAVNLLPFLPLDGGKILRGWLSGVLDWRLVSALLLLLGRAVALAFLLVIWYFGLHRWLVAGVVWLYLLALAEERKLPFVWWRGIVACQGQALRPLRVLWISGRRGAEEAVLSLVRRLSPGWRHVIVVSGVGLDGAADKVVLDGDVLVRDVEAGEVSGSVGDYVAGK